MRRNPDKEEIGNHQFFTTNKAHRYQSRCAFFIQLEFTFFSTFLSNTNSFSGLLFCHKAFFSQLPIMEQDSLENLKSFLEEELFLIPEDLKKLEDELSGTGAINPSSLPTQAVLPPITTTISPILSPSSELETVKEEIKSEPIPMKGNFTKGIVILHEEAELSSEVMDMLVKMINACGHSMNEVGMVSSEHLENRSMEDFQALNAHVVLKFGRIKHPVNAISASPYEIYAEEETEYLFADALTVISEDKNLKRKLWNSLQILFNLATGTK